MQSSRRWGRMAVCVGLALAMAGAQVSAAIVCGNGISTAKDGKAAATEAATKAKAGLGGKEAKLVLVFHTGELIKQRAKVLEGVASVFKPEIVYGACGYATLTQESQEGTVAVLALGGDIEVTAAVAPTKNKDDDVNCGKQIGEALKDAAAKGPGKVLLLWGACHIPRNDQVVAGIRGVLGDDLPIVGAAAFQDHTYAQGKPVTSSNLGILITGKFTIGCGLRKDMSPEGLISSATECYKDAIGDKKDKLALVLTFDCGGRRGEMLKNKNFAKELEAMKAVAGDVPIFGFYGSGEMGCPGTGQPAKGVGYHIAACAICPTD